MADHKPTKYAATYAHDERAWIVQFRDPDIATFGRTLASAKRYARSALAVHLELDDLAAAKAETQFSKAVEAVRHGIPQALLINGHNPLLLLHTALSEGLHAQTDETCLELATSIRIVLTELVERMALALKEEAELKGAVSRLLASRSTPGAGTQ